MPLGFAACFARTCSGSRQVDKIQVNKEKCFFSKNSCLQGLNWQGKSPCLLVYSLLTVCRRHTKLELYINLIRGGRRVRMHGLLRCIWSLPLFCLHTYSRRALGQWCRATTTNRHKVYLCFRVVCFVRRLLRGRIRAWCGRLRLRTARH